MQKKSNIKHLAVIMDGNRRWARERGLDPWEGHREGYKKAKKIVQWSRDVGIKIVTLYAFSTENWKRAKKEVSFLMDLFLILLTKDVYELHKDNVQLRIIGRKRDLPMYIQKAVQKAEKITAKNTGGILNLAISYNGRAELVDAFNKILNKNPKKITEAAISKNIYTGGMPDPDLIIRTSGERRLSGFLLWQSAYSEFYFSDKYWPDFSKKDLNIALDEFARRKRRFGK